MVGGERAKVRGTECVGERGLRSGAQSGWWRERVEVRGTDWVGNRLRSGIQSGWGRGG